MPWAGFSTLLPCRSYTAPEAALSIVNCKLSIPVLSPRVTMRTRAMAAALTFTGEPSRSVMVMYTRKGLSPRGLPPPAFEGDGIVRAVEGSEVGSLHAVIGAGEGEGGVERLAGHRHRLRSIQHGILHGERQCPGSLALGADEVGVVGMQRALLYLDHLHLQLVDLAIVVGVVGVP